MRGALFHWFVDLRESLKESLPHRLFKLKARQLYAEWLIQNPIPVKDQLKFSNKWIKSWENQYVVSLRRPKKRYSIQRDVLIRLQDHLYNVWTVRRFFKEKYGVDPPIINGDQMPLHRNESHSKVKTHSSKKIISFCENELLYSLRLQAFQTSTCSQNSFLKGKECLRQ